MGILGSGSPECGLFRHITERCGLKAAGAGDSVTPSGLKATGDKRNRIQKSEFRSQNGAQGPNNVRYFGATRTKASRKLKAED